MVNVSYAFKVLMRKRFFSMVARKVVSILHFRSLHRYNTGAEPSAQAGELRLDNSHVKNTFQILYMIDHLCVFFSGRRLSIDLAFCTSVPERNGTPRVSSPCSLQVT